MKKLKTLDVFLIVDFVMLILFTIANMIIFCEKGMVSDTLITCFFACFGAENGFIAMVFMVKQHYKNKELNNEEEVMEDD